MAVMPSLQKYDINVVAWHQRCCWEDDKKVLDAQLALMRLLLNTYQGNFSRQIDTSILRATLMKYDWQLHVQPFDKTWLG